MLNQLVVEPWSTGFVFLGILPILRGRKPVRLRERGDVSINDTSEESSMKILYVATLAAALILSPAVLADGSSSASASGSAAGIPELDAGAAGVGFGLVLAVTALIRERRRRK